MINNNTTANESTGLTIGKNLTITDYDIKQRGYGRQSFYLQFAEISGKHYYCDVFPNVEEHFDILLRADAAYYEEKGYYTDCNGNGQYTDEEVYNTIIEALQHKLNGMSIEIEIEEELSDAEIYERVLKFIDTTNNIQLLKDMLTEAFDNSSDRSIVNDAYFNWINK